MGFNSGFKGLIEYEYFEIVIFKSFWQYNNETKIEATLLPVIEINILSNLLTIN